MARLAIAVASFPAVAVGRRGSWFIRIPKLNSSHVIISAPKGLLRFCRYCASGARIGTFGSLRCFLVMFSFHSIQTRRNGGQSGLPVA